MCRKYYSRFRYQLSLQKNKDLLIFLVLTRTATVDMVLWDGTNSPDSQLCAHEVAIGTTEYATRARSSLRCQISAVAGKGHRSLQ